MTVDRLELEERVEALEGDEVDAQWVEHLVEVDLQPPQQPRMEAWIGEENSDVEIRTRGWDPSSGEHTPAVARARTEQVDRRRRRQASPRSWFRSIRPQTTENVPTAASAN
jgi:hypothetical protein